MSVWYAARAVTDGRSWKTASKAGCTPASDRVLERHLRRVGAATVCGNPLGVGPTKQCQHDLTAIPTEPSDERVPALQRRADAALAGHAVPVLGRQVKGARHT